MRRLICQFIVLVGVAGLLATPVLSQATTGTLLGRVLDQTGRVVPGADITATNEETGRRLLTVTDDRGNYTIPFIPGGIYTLKVVLPGFKSRTETGLRISANQKVNKDFVLEVGTPDQSITIVSETPLLNSVNAQQEVGLDNTQVESLPIARRDFSTALTLGPGTSGGGGQITINGLAPRGFTFTVDGVDASPDAEYNSMALYQNFNYIKGVSMEAIQEVEVTKNVFSAEIGQTISGNVNVITKGGTNQFHGSAFEYYQSGGLMAVNHFGVSATQSGKAPQVFHQFGGSIGGPIVKDKVFFFGNYEGYRLTANTVQNGDVPSRWLRDQLVGVLPGADTYFSLWPLPTDPEQPGDVNAGYTGIHPEERDDDHFSIRGDYNITDTDFFTARFTYADPDRLQPRRMLGNPRLRAGFTRNFSTNYTRSWSPKVTSEFRFGYNKSNVDRIDLIWQSQVPSLEVAGSEDSGGELFIKNGSTASFESAWSWTRGSHALKFGGLLRWHRGNRINEEVPNYTFDTVASALMNTADSAAFQFALREFSIRNQFFGLYVQDDIRLKPNFILNLGLRWDYSGVPNERDGRLFNRTILPWDVLNPDSIQPFRDPDSPWEPNYANFSPRVSFAWTIDDSKKTVLRAGYGIFFIPFNLFSGPVEIVKNGLNEPVEAQFRSPDSLTGLDIQYPDYNDDVEPKVAAAGIDADTKIQTNWDTPYSQQWTMGIQRQLTSDMVLDVAYVGNHGTSLLYYPEVNRPISQYGGPGWAGFNNPALLPLPQDNDFRFYNSAESSVYHSLQAQLKKRFSRDFSFNTSYTWASNLSFMRADFTCCGSGEQPQDIFDLNSNRGATEFALRHRFTTDFLYEVPWLRNSDNAVAKAFLGGWSISGIIEAQSGDSIQIEQRGTRTAGARPDLVGTHDSAVFNNWDSSVDGSAVANANGCNDHCYFYLNEAAFAAAPTTTVTDVNGTTYTILARPGTMGRRSIYGPGEWTVDLSLAKNFTVTETSRLQFRADFFNALNHTNLGNPRDRIGSSRFGQITGANSGRVVQFSLRFDF